MRNSSELAEPRRLPTACFGLVWKQETELHTTQVVDLQPEVGDRGAQATREIKRKLNPFVVDCEASATQETMPKGVMASERMRGLALPKPLSLKQCVALLTSPPGFIQDPLFHKTDTHPITMSANSDHGKPHATLHDHVTLSASTSTYGKPFEGTEMPGKSGEDLF